MKFIPRLPMLLLAVGLFVAPFVVHAEVVVISKAGAKVKNLTAEQVAAIFLQQVNKLPDGNPVMVVDLPIGSDIWREFYSKVTTKTPRQLKAYWAKRVFTGKGKPNKILQTEIDVINWVATSADRIAYVTPSVIDTSVTVLLRLP